MKSSVLYILVFLSGLLTSCYPGGDEFGASIEVTTEDIEDADIRLFSTTVRGNYRLLSGSVEISEVGFCWGETWGDLPTIKKDSVVPAEKTKDGGFTAQLTNLSGGTYRVRAYVKAGEQCIYGDEKEFRRLYRIQYKPTVTDVNVSDVSAASAHLTASVTAPDEYPVTEAGFEYRTSTAAHADYTRVKGTYTEGSISLDLTGLTPETSYCIRAYAVNEAGETKSDRDEVTFKTTRVEPSFSEVKIENIVLSSADMSVEVQPYDALHPILEAGFQYYNSRYSSNVSYGNLVKGTLTGNRLALPATNLVRGATYQVRAYARTSDGIFYGATSSFTMLGDDDLPLVTFNGFTISEGTAGFISGVACTAKAQERNAGLPLTEVGFVYIESYSPALPVTLDTSGSTLVKCTLSGDTYSMNLDNLAPRYDYYLIRAYALSGKEAVYNSQTVKVFTQLNNYTPVLGAVSVTKMAGAVANSINAVLSCSVEAVGGIPVTEYGFVCSSTLTNPTVESNDRMLICSGGAFQEIMSFAKPSTGTVSYYIRAYAKNKMGVAYSLNRQFRVSWND